MSDSKNRIKNKHNFIDISPQRIQWGFNANYIEEKDGMFSWYLPSFDIYFSSATKEAGDKKALAITNSFFNYWLKEKGFRRFLMKILRLGYKPASHDELKHLLDRTNLNAHLKGSSKRMPAEFAHAATSDQDGSLAIAV
jgi:hypothetical protein